MLNNLPILIPRIIKLIQWHV